MRTLAVVLVVLSACAPGGGTVCNQSDVGGEACVPSTAQAGTALTLRARPNGCGNTCNGTVGFSCSSVVTGQTIALTITEDRCQEQDDNNPFTPEEACTLACAVPDPIDCAVSGLAEGDYTVTLQGSADQTLQVRATGETQCTAPSP